MLFGVCFLSGVFSVSSVFGVFLWCLIDRLDVVIERHRGVLKGDFKNR